MKVLGDFERHRASTWLWIMGAVILLCVLDGTFSSSHSVQEPEKTRMEIQSACLTEGGGEGEEGGGGEWGSQEELQRQVEEWREQVTQMRERHAVERSVRVKREMEEFIEETESKIATTLLKDR